MSSLNPRKLAWAMSLLAGLALSTPALAQQNAKRTAQAWTLDEAIDQLEMNPNDRYLQYVALQLARREGKLDEIAPKVETIVWGEQWAWNRGAGRRDQVDLFSIFSGKLAVQESLQLDTMRGEARRRQTFNQDNDPQVKEAATKAEKRKQEMVPISKLTGPTIKSHPWEVMLAGKKPEISPLALMVPEDQYYVEFRSVGKLLAITSAGDLYSSYLFNQSSRDSTNAAAPERINQQLAITPSRFTDMAFEKTVEQAAITGSDLFANEGSDLTLIFRLKEPQIFKVGMDAFLTTAEKSRPDAKRKEGKVLGVDYVEVSTPDRAISAFSAWPSPEVHIRSNSLVGLTRVLSAIQGKDPAGKTVKALGATTEFAYIRTLMPQGAKEEDVLVYLSDPFIRRMTGPQVKIVERRRQMAHNHLRMIGHGSLMYQTEFGKKPASMAELASAQCIPGKFGEGDLTVPGGADYALSADGTTGFSSKYGHPHFLTPCCEMPITEVTGEEADLYNAFLADYNQYWRTFFDPIAIRVQVTPQKYRAETIILPLIDNTLYSGLAQALGGKPETLDALPVPKRNIATLNFRLHKERWNEQITEGTNQVPWLLREFTRGNKELPTVDVKDFVLNGLGNQIGLNVYDGPRTFEFNFSSFLGQAMGTFNVNGQNRIGGMGGEMFPIAMLIGSLNAPVYISIPVKDPKIVDKFLADLDPLEAAIARQRPQGGWFQVENDFYQLPASGDTPVIRCHAISFGPVKWRFFWARIDNGLYIASKKFILDDLVTAHVARRKPGPDALPVDQGPAAHAMVRLRPSQWREIRPEFELGWSENSRGSSLNNLGSLSNIARALAARPATDKKPSDDEKMAEIERVAEQVYGVRFVCPEGGKYQLASDGVSVVSEIFGSPIAPRQPAAPSKAGQVGRLLADLWQVTAELTFLEDGLHAVLTIDRTAPRQPAP